MSKDTHVDVPHNTVGATGESGRVEAEGARAAGPRAARWPCCAATPGATSVSS